MKKNQIKSKERVKNYGEVLTGEREVKAMVGLVKDEVEKLKSKVLEPACGNGNFLVEILDVKMQAVKRASININEAIDIEDYERNTFIAVSNIYGIDILKDNVQESIDRMIDVVVEHYMSLNIKITEDFQETLRFVLSKNIVWGDTLARKAKSDNAEEDEPIIFINWEMESLDKNLVRRLEYTLDSMVENEQAEPINVFDEVDFREVMTYEL